MKRPKTEIIIEAIKDSGGIKSTIAERLSVDWHTADAWIRRNRRLSRALANEKEHLKDDAKGVVRNAIKDDKDVGTAKWLLSRLAKDEGFGDSSEISGPNGGPIQMTFVDWMKKHMENKDAK